MSQDKADQVTGLTPNDVKLIQSTWAEIIKHAEDNGVVLLGLLLERYPEYITLFPFKDVPQSEFENNHVFREHSISTAGALNAIVEIIGDSTKLVPHLTKVGYTHLVKKVDREAFLHFRQVILDVFSTLFKPEEIAAWEKALNVIFLSILSGLSAAEQFGSPELESK